MTTATQPTQGDVKVRAKVNERKFFETMRHMFSTSFSVLGELMQNSRRAGASRIDLEVDVEKRSLAIVDNGRGISDFRLVIAMCESGWDEQTMLTDKPFGMGLFSVFFAAKYVVFRSGGKTLTVSLDDVINKRELSVKEDPHAAQVATGTRIELMELDGVFLRDHTGAYCAASKHGSHAVFREIEKRALGFPIPVAINGVECERPHAQSALQGVETTVGFVSLQGVTHGGGAIPQTGKRQCYLQGLPIGANHRYSEPIVVHLDPTQFVALMPDRADLFDAAEQNRKIDQALKAMVSNHLAVQKASMPSMEFARSHWDNCDRHGSLALMNDIPWVPERVLKSVDQVKKNPEDAWSAGHESVLIARDDFVDGSVKAWFDAPSGTVVAETAALILKVMQQESIHNIDDCLPSEHWLRNLAPSVHDLRFHWSVEGAEGEEVVHGDMGACQISLANSVEVHVRSTTSDFEMRTVFSEGWVMVPEAPVEDYEETYDFIGGLVCYVFGKGGMVDSPVDALSDFTDEYDHFRDDWRDEAEQEWDQKVMAMRGTNLADVIDQVLGDGLRQIGEKQAKTLCLVAVDRVANPLGTQGRLRHVVVDLAMEDFWTQMAIHMASGREGSELLELATQLRVAFGATKDTCVARQGL